MMRIEYYLDTSYHPLAKKPTGEQSYITKVRLLADPGKYLYNKVNGQITYDAINILQILEKQWEERPVENH